jgi:hypothetical protein
VQYPSGRAGNYDSAPTTFIIATNSFLAFAARSATDGRLFSMGARVESPRQRGAEVLQAEVLQHQTKGPFVLINSCFLWYEAGPSTWSDEVVVRWTGP